MATHTFNLNKIKKEEEKIKYTLKNTSIEIDRLIEKDQARDLWGLVMIFVFIALAGLTFLYNKGHSK